MADEIEKFGSIHVEMGDGNAVGDIGHKITYHAPPPPPNGLYQGGTLCGEFEGQPSLEDGSYRFSKLFVAASFDRAAGFEIQGVRLVIERLAAITSASIGGRPPITTLWNVVCRVL
jgi:hypothetical protein